MQPLSQNTAVTVTRGTKRFTAPLLALALWQAWVFRHEISPDGVAYLDLSDAIVNGRPGELVNGYWSPLYPTLLGLIRLLVSWTPLGEPRWEFAILHVANLAGFALAVLAFDWFLRAVDSAGERWGALTLRSPIARLGAWALFGVAMLDMISVKGTVPDLLLAAAIFAALACAVQLHVEPGDRHSAILLGVMLGLGALTKSFLFPLGAVVLATVAVATWRRSRWSAAIATATFGAVVLPWVIAVSLSLGRFSTGETGSLNYAWYVNGIQPHNTGVMPKLAAPAEPLPLDGLAVLAGARGTNPLWYDPARWNRDVRPRFSLAQQWPKLRLSAQYYAYVFAPFLVMLAAVVAGARLTDIRAALARSWVVLVPCLAAFAAYSLVYTTSRYVAAFLVAGCVILAAAFPRESPLSGRRFFTGAVAALLLCALIAPFRGRILLAAGALVVVTAWLAYRHSRGDVPPLGRVVRVFAFAVIVAAALPGLLMGIAALRGRPADPHPHWTTARQLLGQGLQPGSRIAFMGNPENSGWARLARYQIVAVIPTDRVDAFKRLPEAERARIVAAFQRAGAVQLLELNP
jgi:4-amino-4-deoxy-L-arabinose transferase-like glycosyltransferase